MQRTEPASLVGALRRSKPDELEAGLNSLIERRASQRQDADEKEESWRESVRQYHGEIREANRHAWCTYYRRLARNHAGLSEHFESKASALDPGEGDS